MPSSSNSRSSYQGLSGSSLRRFGPRGRHAYTGVPAARPVFRELRLRKRGRPPEAATLFPAIFGLATGGLRITFADVEG
jgi:hypothetical protein